MAKLSNRRRKEIRKLRRRKYRKELGQTLVEGVRAVQSALEAGAPLVDVLVTGEALQQASVREMLQNIEVPVYEVEPGELDQLSRVESHQGIMAVVERTLQPVDQLVHSKSILLLDGVQDPGNVGTLMRTAAWFGVDAVVGASGTAGLFHPKVMRAAMGAQWDLVLSTVGDAGELRSALPEEDVQFVGADVSGTPLREWKPLARTVLIMGSEAHGLSGASQSAISQRITIPGAAGREGTESLNVAVSGGILLYGWLGR